MNGGIVTCGLSNQVRASGKIKIAHLALIHMVCIVINVRPSDDEMKIEGNVFAE
jgi:hypothetical protein